MKTVIKYGVTSSKMGQRFLTYIINLFQMVRWLLLSSAIFATVTGKIHAIMKELNLLISVSYL